MDDLFANRDVLRRRLEQEGYLVETAENGDDALRVDSSENPDLIVLDLMLPGRSGMDVLRTLRARGARPVIMLTARDDVTDKVLGLELGADDYVTKPFHPRELVARVRTVLRRGVQASDLHYNVGDLNIDIDRREVRLGESVVDLTRIEFDLLAALARAQGRVLTRGQLLEAFLGEDAFTLERSVDSHIRNLRRKIEPVPGESRYVITVIGVGYRIGGT